MMCLIAHRALVCVGDCCGGFLFGTIPFIIPAQASIREELELKNLQTQPPNTHQSTMSSILAVG